MSGQPIVLRPRVTPDPEAAATLEQKLRALRYYPENGLLRDHQQRRIATLPSLLRRQAE